MRDQVRVCNAPGIDLFIVSKYGGGMRVLKDTGSFSP